MARSRNTRNQTGGLRSLVTNALGGGNRGRKKNQTRSVVTELRGLASARGRKPRR